MSALVAPKLFAWPIVVAQTEAAQGGAEAVEVMARESDEDRDEDTSLELMKTAHGLGGEWTTRVLLELVERSSFETMRWVLEQGCTFPASEAKASLRAMSPHARTR